MRLLLLLIITTLSACSNNNVAGGSTSVGNGVVAASLTFNGTPVSTEVMLVPADYSPGVDSTINIIKILSDSNGIVEFDNLPDAEYSIVVIDTIEQFGIVTMGVHPSFDDKTTMDIALGKLGTFAYYLPDSLAAKASSVSIMGTTIYDESNTFTQYENQIKQVLFNNIPIGDNLISAIEINGSPLFSVDTIFISTGDTTAATFKDIVIEKLRPVWKFPLIVGVTSDMISTYGDLDSVKILIEDHLLRAEVSLHSEAFKGYSRYPVDSIYEITGTLNDENYSPPQGFAYRLLYSPNEKSPFGGWVRDSRVMVQDYAEMDAGGVFGDESLIGLRWLMGHSRGAYYVLQEEVYGVNNLISGTSYTPEETIMSLSHTSNWIDYNIELINLNESKWDKSVDSTILLSVDTLQINLLDSLGIPLEGAVIEGYGVIPFSWSVSETILLGGTSDSTGNIKVEAPYLSIDKKKITYPNLLIKITYNGNTTYKWIPYSEVSLYYLNTGESVFYKQITI